MVLCMRVRVSLVDFYIGQRIRRTRLFRAISLTQLSSRLDLSLRQLSAYENGEARIPADILLQISKLLHVNWQLFFDSKVDKTLTLVEPPTLLTYLPANDNDLLHKIGRHQL